MQAVGSIKWWWLRCPPQAALAGLEHQLKAAQAQLAEVGWMERGWRCRQQDPPSVAQCLRT